MINERMYQLGSQPNMIRKLYAYGLDRKAEVGEENVFDYSIGNPSIPAPAAVRSRIEELLEEPAEQLTGAGVGAPFFQPVDSFLY